MNREKASELLPIIQAFADGKDIQCHQMNDTWKTIETPQFNEIAEYRVKPEPIEIWCMIDSNKDLIAKSFRNCDDCQNWIDELNKKHNGDYLDYKPVLFRQAMVKNER